MIPYTDKAKKALNYANRLSRSSGCNYVGTEHILAGLLKEGTGVAAEVLTANNVELEALLKLIFSAYPDGAGSCQGDGRPF